MKKNKLGQFFTKEKYWQEEQVLNFIENYNFKLLVDPFAGGGDLLKSVKYNCKKIGFDIDKSLKNKWKYNDSLQNIPYIKNGFVLTNPPYLSKSSNKRKNINHNAFKKSNHNDLYKIALEKLLNSKMPGVAILPESFINSSFSKKHIFSITILIPNPFKDTEVPVCIVCYDPNKNFKEVQIYKNHELIGTIKSISNNIKKILTKSNNKMKIRFNDEQGELALIAYDTFSGKKIKFIKSKNLSYNRPQKISSRVISKIKINRYISNKIISQLNNKLRNYRKSTHDVFLTPFKGNDIYGNRRRRLDYKTARLIINSIIM